MKKSILLIISLLLAELSISQVGINTEDPKGVFHIDAKGDTGAQGVKFSDDIVVNTEGKMGIGTLTPQARLDINGNLRIADAPVIANAAVLVRDGTTGMVGTAVSVPTKVAFIQSIEAQLLTTQAEKDLFNTAVPVQVTWSSADIVSNNVVDFNDTSDIFTISQTGLYELSGFMNYATYSTIPTTYPTTVDAGRAGVNVSIQVDKNDGKGWTDFTAARIVFTGTAVHNTSQTIIVPPGVLIFDKGTKIRMVFLRPATNFGLAHGTSGNNGIALPAGILFSKGMKILAL
ncbi:hypothetical protein CLV62_101399 [Dysgonomonas alginatilytica]|uniref:Uncharacterized protein n=1 Tax=Dysgonomonas alginatilytica TaxID=1605892 RepID=A0A2V3PTU7_9BACT|nr:hypothetical protein [Dysgonomonas alginatilytica]PXV69130.1 hypothetical protein CLV62_101399 [Dysgonomonas alginatilytica]